MVKSAVLATATAAVMLAVAQADVYLHNPRGSNNRLNERSANRNNGNRMFDSQNNNRGGYNKGDVSDQAAGAEQRRQYDMQYYQSDPTIGAGTDLDQTTAGSGQTVLSIEWTNQHGCGGNEHGDPHKLNCQIILQYMCIDAQNTGTAKDGVMDPASGAVDGFRENCDFECMIPNAANPLCDEPTAPFNKPACGLSEIDDKDFCEIRGYVWVPAQVNDQFNCPHTCGGAGGSSRIECTANGGTWTQGYTDGAAVRRRFRDGVTTSRQDYTNLNNANEDQSARANRKRGNVQPDRGLHESWEWYDECYRRERNRGLFTADQNLRNNNLGYSSAVYTRQNPNNNRRGYECPEERDHFPYWHPSPWRDIAVLTDRLDQCDYYRQESQNVKGKNLCRNTATCRNCVRYNNKPDCDANNGRWVEVGAWNIAPPACVQAPWSRVNHLGNGRFGQANTYNWTIPSFSRASAAAAEGKTLQQFDQQCVTRLRYNISTDDYDAWRVNNSFNQNNGQGIKSPVQQNPAVDPGTVGTALRLAINTAQFGRTFQDRSHVLTFQSRPVTSLGASNDEKCAFATAHGTAGACVGRTPIFQGKKIHNLNVRGKRCNIVQCFPSVEYDFAPNHLHIGEQDLVHIQWTGSNTHNNGNPAGDGQAGDAGEGRRGTDRHNIVELRSRAGSDFGGSFPAPWESNTMFKNLVNVYAPESSYTCDHAEAGCTEQGLQTCAGATNREQCWEELKQSWAVRMATAGHYNGFSMDKITEASAGYEPAFRPTAAQALYPSNGQALQELLNNAPASFVGGVMQFKRGTYNYMNTRNHNFSNRDQKGHLIVR